MERRLELLEMEVLYRENDGSVVIFRHIDNHILGHISMNGMGSRKSCKTRAMTPFALLGKFSFALFSSIGIRVGSRFKGSLMPAFLTICRGEADRGSGKPKNGDVPPLKA